jgi:hypothetical protein
MGLFGKREDSKKFKLAQAEKFNNLVIESVTERLDNEEILVGKAGSTSTRGNRFIICSEGKVVFEGDIFEISISELMSRNGIIVRGWDFETERERTVVAHFSYYRKLTTEG